LQQLQWLSIILLSIFIGVHEDGEVTAVPILAAGSVGFHGAYNRLSAHRYRQPTSSFDRAGQLLNGIALFGAGREMRKSANADLQQNDRDG
jgi:hypothetical protein